MSFGTSFGSSDRAGNIEASSQVSDYHAEPHFDGTMKMRRCHSGARSPRRCETTNADRHGEPRQFEFKAKPFPSMPLHAGGPPHLPDQTEGQTYGLASHSLR